ncbi:MAG: 1-acyl-sn-glycerol-3-phosphate acyltransferase [Tannerella sp.]|jgi:putative hemolysin|nr:1-acyl-sn-glycerol-3-phosphate acyltransferase [Tannerella sp.]
MFINVKQVLKSKLGSKAEMVPSFVVNYLTRLIHQDEINDIIVKFNDLYGVDFMNALIGYFNINLIIKNEENLPKDGQRYIFASNHPLGGLDGICLSAVIGNHYDKKIKYPVNDLLLHIPNLQTIFVPVNKHGAQKKASAKEMEEAFSSDNQIITFPAGLCSRKQKGTISDLEWKKSFIQKAIEYKRNIVPVYFEGENSNFFYRFANFRKRFGIKFNIEMLLLPDEMFKNKNKTFSITIGKPIAYQDFNTSKKPVEWAEEIKKTVYKLADK